MNLSFFLIRICFNPRALAGGRDRLPHLRRPGNAVSIPASSREDATSALGIEKIYRQFQSPRPRGRTRRIAAAGNCRATVSIPASSREDATLCPVCLFVAGHVSIPVPLQSRNLAISRSRNLAISQSRNLAISQSRNLAIMDCSLQAAGERKVKTMAKICQAETAIRGSLRVHDKRKPLNARRMPMHSFVSTPLQGTLDPME